MFSSTCAVILMVAQVKSEVTAPHFSLLFRVDLVPRRVTE